MFFKSKHIIIWMILSLVHYSEPIIISNVNLIFETFNPISMVQFYEFNDKEYNITDSCIQDMFLYLDGLHRDIFWAVKCLYICVFSYSTKYMTYNRLKLNSHRYIVIVKIVFLEMFLGWSNIRSV